MAKDDYFSFGDEDLESAFDAASPGEDEFSGPTALALADPPEPLVTEESSPTAAKRATRPRGDSESGSSERRGPSSRRSHLAVTVTLVLAALVIVRIGISAVAGGGGASAPQPTIARQAERSAEAQVAPPAPERAEQLRASRQRAAERQQVRQRRAKTRRRARRSRQRRSEERSHRAGEKREEKAAQEASSDSSESPAPAYLPPPAAEPAPPTSAPAPEASEPPPPPRGEGGLHDGSSSPEFGL